MGAAGAPVGLSEALGAAAVAVVTLGALAGPAMAGAPPTPIADVGVIAVLGACSVRLLVVGRRSWGVAIGVSALVWALVGLAPLTPVEAELIVSRWAHVPLAIVVTALATRMAGLRALWAGCSALIAVAAGAGMPFPSLLAFGCLVLVAAGRRGRPQDVLTGSAAALGLALIALDQRVLGQDLPPVLLTISVDVVLVGAAALLAWSLTEDQRAWHAFEATGEQGDITRWLANVLGRASLSVAFPGDGETTLDLAGSRVVPDIGSTAVTDRDGRVVAWVSPPALEGGMLASTLTGLLASLGEVARMRRREMDQADEVSTSRRRLQAAADEEARSLERQFDQTVMTRLATMRDLVATTQHAGLVARVDAVAAELLRHARGLDPLAERSLTEALATHADRGVTVSVDPSIADTAAARTAWYIATEALTNAAKHAPGAAVTVNVRALRGSVEVVVTDQGPGGADRSGAGLVGLVDRVEAVGGTFRLTSTPSGTTVAAQIPCRASPAPVLAHARRTDEADYLASRP